MSWSRYFGSGRLPSRPGLLVTGCSGTRSRVPSQSCLFAYDTEALISHVSAYRYYADMVNEYGPVVSFRYGRRIVCIVGRYQVCYQCIVVVS